MEMRQRLIAHGRLILYSLATQMIVVLSAVRERAMPLKETTYDELWRIRYDRTYYANNFESWTCCDCGLMHLTRPLDGERPRFPAFKFIPLRPHGYNYLWRYGGAPSSPSVDESQKVTQ